MREYRTAELMNIGAACVVIVVMLVAGVALIYQRCQQLSPSGTTLESERMIELTTLHTDTCHPEMDLEAEVASG